MLRSSATIYPLYDHCAFAWRQESDGSNRAASLADAASLQLALSADFWIIASMCDSGSDGQAIAKTLGR